jgi:hypothetical protein
VALKSTATASIPLVRFSFRGNKGRADRVQARLDTPRQSRAFKRNDQMLNVLPIGVIVFPGFGISANLADKAKKLGIPVWKFAEGSA